MFNGIIPALITPTDDEGKLNVPALEALLEKLIAEGADGFYLCGATGEGLIISADLHRAMVRESLRIINGRVPSIVHVARTDFTEMEALARYAESEGAAAISAIPPIFYKYSEDEIYGYYERLCRAVDIPVVIYNNPNTGVSFSPALLKRLFGIQNLNAIKWTNYDFATVLNAKAQNPDVCFINGPDEMLLFGLMAGCDAGIGTTYNFLLPDIKRIYTLFKQGRYDEAQRVQSYVDGIIAALLGHGNVIVITKFILSRLGIDAYHTVFPTVKLTEECEKELTKALRKAGMQIS